MAFFAAAAPIIGAIALGAGAGAIASQASRGRGGNVAPLPKPAPMPVAPKPQEQSTTPQAAAESVRQRVGKKKTQSIYSSPLGIGGEAEVAKKKLLGQ